MEECYKALLAVVTAATVSFMEDKSVLVRQNLILSVWTP